MGLVFYKLHVTESTIGVPNNLLSTRIFKRYVLTTAGVSKLRPAKPFSSGLKDVLSII